MYFSKDKKNNAITIETKDKAFQDIIGNEEGLSFLDIKTLNAMYKCKPASCDKTDDSCPGFVDEKCRCLCQSQHEGSRLKLCDDVSTEGMLCPGR